MHPDGRPVELSRCLEEQGWCSGTRSHQDAPGEPRGHSCASLKCKMGVGVGRLEKLRVEAQGHPFRQVGEQNEEGPDL